MEKFINDDEKDIIEVLKEMADKLNEIIEWINNKDNE